tara:strand:+ start:13921 stop:14163 length:243 start_codon:yes stop_codon:yes gene_type:complete
MLALSAHLFDVTVQKILFSETLFLKIKKSLFRIKKGCYICTRIWGIPNETLGEMAEWSNAAVLKTVEGHTSGGSNPSFSA